MFGLPIAVVDGMAMIAGWAAAWLYYRIRYHHC